MIGAQNSEERDSLRVLLGGDLCQGHGAAGKEDPADMANLRRPWLPLRAPTHMVQHRLSLWPPLPVLFPAVLMSLRSALTATGSRPPGLPHLVLPVRKTLSLNRQPKGSCVSRSQCPVTREHPEPSHFLPQHTPDMPLAQELAAPPHTPLWLSSLQQIQECQRTVSPRAGPICELVPSVQAQFPPERPDHA